MRKQQINLYQPVFRKQPVTFSFNMLLILLLVSLLAMGGLYGIGGWQSARLAEQLSASRAQRDQLDQDVTRLAAQLPKPTVNKMLESELQQLTQKRKSGFALLNMLKSRIAANQEGFSGIFEGLARRSFPELWFTQVAITEAGTALTLKGKSLKPEWVPRLLQNLHQEPAFSERSFQVVELVRRDQFSPLLDFNLTTTRGSEEP